MNREQFDQQARVVAHDNAAIGDLVDVDNTSNPPVIIVSLDEPEQRRIRVPLDYIDYDRSSGGEIVLLTDAQSVFGQATDAGAGETLHIPILEEQLRVRTRNVETGRVVVRKRVETVPTEVPVDLTYEDVEVERVTLNRVVDEAPQLRQEGDTVIVPVIEEVLVVEKRLRLVEELRITKRRVTEETTVREDLRREVVDVVEEDATGQGKER